MLGVEPAIVSEYSIRFFDYLPSDSGSLEDYVLQRVFRSVKCSLDLSRTDMYVNRLTIIVEGQPYLVSLCVRVLVYCTL